MKTNLNIISYYIFLTIAVIALSIGIIYKAGDSVLIAMGYSTVALIFLSFYRLEKSIKDKNKECTNEQPFIVEKNYPVIKQKIRIIE